jgi:hypothetical protein
MHTKYGGDRHLIHVCPESNNSIQQGGLAFYVMKDKGRIAGPWHDSTFVMPRQQGWIPEQCKWIEGGNPQYPPLPWFKNIGNIIESTPSFRLIYWIFTLEHGDVAKSNWCTYAKMKWKHVKSIGHGTPSQIKDAVSKLPDIYTTFLLDIPKSHDSNIKLSDYINVIETIKNGDVQGNMHGVEKENVMNHRPHVFVFSNMRAPRDAMTKKRFIEVEISPDGKWTFVDGPRGTQGSKRTIDPEDEGILGGTAKRLHNSGDPSGDSGTAVSVHLINPHCKLLGGYKSR